MVAASGPGSSVAAPASAAAVSGGSNLAFSAVVIDANAIITAGPGSLAGLARRYVTVAEALAEVRDARARQVLALLPFPLETRQPAEASIAAVRDFARKTGDLARLSRTDVLLLALTHQLEREANGARFLRSEPPSTVTQASRVAAATAAATAAAGSDGATTAGGQAANAMPECRFFHTVGGCRAGEGCRFVHVGVAGPRGAAAAASAPSTSAATSTSAAAAAGSAEGGPPAVSVSALKGGLAAVTLSVPSGSGSSESAAPNGSPSASTSTAVPAAPSTAAAAAPHLVPAKDAHHFAEAAAAALGASASTVADPDGEGVWIVPTPPRGAAAAAAAAVAAAAAAAAATASGPAPRVAVALVTSDFAMQNVALQAGMLLASTAGKVVTSVKSWVLKCDACFTVTDKMDKTFCPRCGNATLARLGVTLGADGAPRFHVSANRQISTRGTQFALPAPRGGRTGDLLLREDQMLTGVWAQRARGGAAHEASMFADRTPGSGADEALLRRDAPVTRTAGGMGSVGGAGNPAIVVGLGKRNPNEAHRRK